MTRQSPRNKYPVRPYHIAAASGVSPVEAGFGLVQADTLIATVNDEFRIAPENARFELRVGKRRTSGPVAALGCGPGIHPARLRVASGTNPLVEKDVKLILVDASRVCRRFGARYGSLEYDLPVITGKSRWGGKFVTAPWASLWKTGEAADIVVDFNAPYKLVLWRGMAYTPSWALNNIMTSNFFAETLEPGRFRDCCEMMSDRECRYSHARVIHSSDARVVIHWRYALNDTAYTICRNQWADEMLYVYPDGTAVRNVTVHLDPNDETAWIVCPRTDRRIPCPMISGQAGKRAFNDMEFITVNAPGATSDDNMPLDALTILDGRRFARTYRWPQPSTRPVPALAEHIFRINYRHRPGVFVASPAAGLKFSLAPNTAAVRYMAGARVEDDSWDPVRDIPANFGDYIHWPVTRGFGTTPLSDRSQYLDRPTHTFLGYAHNDPVEVRDDGAVTWSWFCGMAPENDAELRARVRAWTAPALIKGTVYNSQQRAYIVKRVTKNIVLEVDPEHAVIHPTWVLPGCRVLPKCHGGPVRVAINGGCLTETSVSVGVERTLASAQTVITLAETLPPGSKVEIKTG
ncbi:MAG: hypothetical protein NT011_03060 [Kiritimatiellaeota bacterium]|nr:hypothetical protein [Kiritimatiellota bacterium]